MHLLSRFIVVSITITILASPLIIQCSAIAQQEPVTYHVDDNAQNDNGPGTKPDWSDAYMTLQAALNNPNLKPSDTILVAQGVYKPGAPGETGKSFLLQSGVTILPRRPFRPE